MMSEERTASDERGGDRGTDGDADERAVASGSSRLDRPHPAARVFEADGRRWLVRERLLPLADEASRPSLIFESDGIARRLRTYPAGWFDLPDDELYRLSVMPPPT